MDIAAINRKAWDRQVEEKNKWTIPVSKEQIEAARNGRWEVVLTPKIPVPRNWFGQIEGAKVLGLASGGGQQCPILAAAGADVTVLDNSPAQLEQDRMVADSCNLDMQIELGMMEDLSRFANNSFDLIFHPVSNVFMPNVLPVWREAFRVLKPGGRLLAGFTNPLLYLFDPEKEERDEHEVCNKIPYSDANSLSEAELARRMSLGWPLEFGHSLDDQIGGQIKAGFSINGFFEDTDDTRKLGQLIPLFMATLAIKPN